MAGEQHLLPTPPPPPNHTLHPTHHPTTSPPCFPRAKANFQDLVDLYTYGLPPDINFTYTRNGPEIVLPGPAAITNSTITNSTLPGCARQYVVRPGDFCFFIASSMGERWSAWGGVGAGADTQAGTCSASIPAMPPSSGCGNAADRTRPLIRPWLQAPHGAVP